MGKSEVNKDRLICFHEGNLIPILRSTLHKLKFN